MGTFPGQKPETISGQAGSALVKIVEQLKLPPAAADQICALADKLVGPFGVSTKSEPRPIGSDGSSFAFSVVLDEQRPEIHLLWQPVPATAEPEARAAAAAQEQARLQEIFGASAARFELASSIMLPGGAAQTSALHYSARVWPALKSPRISAHFDAQALGSLQGPRLVEEALSRLGLDQAWIAVSDAMPRGPEVDEVVSLAVELSSEADAGVEVRIRHHELDSVTLQILSTIAANGEPGQFERFVRGLTGGELVGVNVDTSLSFVSGQARPVATTLHVPICDLVEHDGQVAERVTAASGAASAKLHAAVVEAVSKRPLSAGVGVTSSFALCSPGARLSCQLSLEQFGAKPAQSLTRTAAPVKPVEAMVTAYEAQPFSVHPFLQRMARGTVDVRHMWLMFSNVYAGLSQHFPRRLARVVHGVEDERIRCILTEQLHEELGSGDYTRTHRRLFLQLLEALSPWKPREITADMSVPGAHLSERLEAVYYDPHPYAGVGAAIVIELLGKQVDMFLAEQFRRQQAVGMASLEWLTLHESLEVDHANESMELATFIEQDGDRAAAWRGGRAIHTTGWLFFDDMYRLCFGT
jgi:pyrroloquinoline quinone (PQQ) biosynthesis protein C